MCFSSCFPHDFDNVLTDSTLFLKKSFWRQGLGFADEGRSTSAICVTTAVVKGNGKEYFKCHLFLSCFLVI